MIGNQLTDRLLQSIDANRILFQGGLKPGQNRVDVSLSGRDLRPGVVQPDLEHAVISSSKRVDRSPRVQWKTARLPLARVQKRARPRLRRKDRLATGVNHHIPRTAAARQE